jgi:O-antigen ligase
MAKKKRSYPASGTSAQQSGSSSAKTNLPVTSGSTDRKGSQAGQRMGAATPTINLPFEVQRGDWTVIILALMMFLTPAIGVPNELMLQDTLKSIVVAFATVCAGLLFFWQQRNRRDALRWHGLMWLPLALMFYALGSMVWSHTFLGGVEAIRWFLFSLMLWLGVNTLSRERTPYLIEGIHWGAFVCSLWTVLQFYFDFTFFPQGPNPASTFVNRNFFAEFVVCTFPFTLYLLAQGKSTSRIALTAFVLGFNVIALMMTGTRGALAAFWILVVLIFPLILVLYRKQFAFYTWDSGRRILACGVLMATILTMGLISSGNPKVISDRSSYGNVTTPFDMAFKRTASISAQDGSLGIRLVMWKATAGMIKAVPFKGVGAGAWEAMLPLYQTEGSQLETDYYVHNEVLQLLAEYGAVGWVFLFALFSYLLVAAWKTLRNKTTDGLAEAPSGSRGAWPVRGAFLPWRWQCWPRLMRG